LNARTLNEVVSVSRNGRFAGEFVLRIPFRDVVKNLEKAKQEWDIACKKSDKERDEKRRLRRNESQRKRRAEKKLIERIVFQTEVWYSVKANEFFLIRQYGSRFYFYGASDKYSSGVFNPAVEKVCTGIEGIRLEYVGEF